MTDSSWLRNKVRARLAAAGCNATVVPIAVATGIREGSLRAMLDRPDSIKAGNLNKLATALGVPVEWLTNGRTDDAVDNLDAMDLGAMVPAMPDAEEVPTPAEE
jgi:hypothetical protein